MYIAGGPSAVSTGPCRLRRAGVTVAHVLMDDAVLRAPPPPVLPPPRARKKKNRNRQTSSAVCLRYTYIALERRLSGVTFGSAVHLPQQNRSIAVFDLKSILLVPVE